MRVILSNDGANAFQNGIFPANLDTAI